jgi:hypothetical protein
VGRGTGDKWGGGGVETYGEKQQKRNQKHGKEVKKTKQILKELQYKFLTYRVGNIKKFFKLNIGHI